VKTSRNDNTKFSIIASDKLTDKFEKLDLSGSLQISILGGKIKVLAEGSADYLNKKRSNKRQSSIHVTFQYKTAIKTLTMDQLDDSNLNHPNLQTSGRIGSATHVVTQIQYGAEATLTFTKTITETEDEQEVNGQLKLSAETFIKCLKGNANVRGDLEDTSRERENHIECHFQGDFKFPPHIPIPTTYEEAIEFAKKFIQLSTESVAKDADGIQPLGVPIFVWLYPLVLMKDAQNAQALRYEISSTLASECVRIMQNYEDVEDKVHYMLEDPLVKNLRPFQEKIKRFQQYLKSFRAELKMKLGEMVVDIRSGKAKVDAFSQFLNRISNTNFPFNANHLDGWMTKKHKELCMMKRFQDEATSKINNRDKVNIFPSTEKLQEQMTKFPVEFGFELTFTWLAREEIILEQLNQTLDTEDLITSEIPTTSNSNDVLWFENNFIIERIQKEIVVFAELANNYSNDKKFAFAITAHEKYKEIYASQFSIIFHNKHKRIFIWEPILNVFQNYPKEKFIDVFSLGCDYFHDKKFIEFIRLIVEEEISKDWNHIPLLALCRYYNKENLIDIIQLFIEKNIDVDCNDIDGDNALTLLCQCYNKENLIDIVRLLIDNNIDVNGKDNDGWNALLTVCRYYKNDNLIDVVRLLIETNIDVRCKTNGGWNALLTTCKSYDKENLIDIIRLLIEKNIDVNCKTNRGNNALTLLCQNYKKGNLIDIVRLLIETNIDVDCNDINGDNALTLLCQCYNKENLIDIVRLLIDNKIDVNCKDNDGWNALLTVCRYYDKDNLIDIVRLLIEANVDVQCKTNGGNNALTLLCQFYNKENLIDIVQLLIEKNIDVNCKNNGGKNALHFVCLYEPRRRLVDLVRLLVLHNIDKKGKTTDGGVTARSILSNRFKEEEIKDVLQLLDS
jgi:ankyrin repeat protein